MPLFFVYEEQGISHAVARALQGNPKRQRDPAGAVRRLCLRGIFSGTVWSFWSGNDTELASSDIWERCSMNPLTWLFGRRKEKQYDWHTMTE
ncbi:MAG: hypothetical protein ACLUD2_05240 [Clostridium sp.]